MAAAPRFVRKVAGAPHHESDRCPLPAGPAEGVHPKSCTAPTARLRLRTQVESYALRHETFSNTPKLASQGLPAIPCKPVRETHRLPAARFQTLMGRSPGEFSVTASRCAGTIQPLYRPCPANRRCTCPLCLPGCANADTKSRSNPSWARLHL